MTQLSLFKSHVLGEQWGSSSVHESPVLLCQSPAAVRLFNFLSNSSESQLSLPVDLPVSDCHAVALPLSYCSVLHHFVKSFVDPG